VAAESPDGTSSETWTSTPEEPFLFEAESRPCTPLAESNICGTESTPAPLGEGPSPLSQLSTPRPPVKHGRKIQDESASEALKILMHKIGSTLEHFTSTGEHNDEIAAHSKVFEHRLRQLPRNVLPHFLHDVENRGPSRFLYGMVKSLPCLILWLETDRLTALYACIYV